MEYPWLMLGDCLDRMKEIPDGSVDMILADLPYGTTQNRWDSVIAMEPLWNHYLRVLRSNRAIALFGNEPFSSYLRLAKLKLYKYDWVWDKVKPNGHLNAKKQPMMLSEQILIFGEGRLTYNPIMVPRDKIKKSKVYSISDNYTSTQKVDASPREYKAFYPKNHLVFSNASQKNKLHPTQKPVPLLEYLIRTYTNESEVVLDNTMGSGSTGVACVNTNRKFIGIEKDEKYFAIAESRIKAAAELQDQMLFG